MNIYQRLNKARNDFHSLELKKSGENKFAGYQYFELADFLIPALKVFSDAGLCGVVSFDEAYARIVITNIEKPEEQIAISSPLGSAQLKGCHPVQNIGAVESYQRRYLWMATLEVVEHDVIDASEPIKETKAAAKVKPTDGAMESLSAQERQQARKFADVIQQAYVADDGWKAYEEWDSIDGSVEFKTAIWSLLDSKCRAAIKQMKEQSPEVTA